MSKELHEEFYRVKRALTDSAAKARGEKRDFTAEEKAERAKWVSRLDQIKTVKNWNDLTATTPEK